MMKQHKCNKCKKWSNSKLWRSFDKEDKLVYQCPECLFDHTRADTIETEEMLVHYAPHVASPIICNSGEVNGIVATCDTTTTTCPECIAILINEGLYT